MPGWMPEVLADGGIIMYPLLVVAALVLGLTVRAAWRLGRSERPSRGLESGIDAILFWAGFGVVLGVLGTLIGVVQAAQAIELAGGAEAVLVWGGIKVALVSTIFALLVLALALPAWLALRWGFRRRVGPTAA